MSAMLATSGQLLSQEPVPAALRAAPSEVEAFVGQPFGVLSFEIPLVETGQIDPDRVIVSEASGRLFFPAVIVRTARPAEAAPRVGGGRRPGRLLDRVRNVIRGEESRREIPVALQVRALFTGDGPLDIQLSGGLEFQSVIRVESAPERQRAAIENWWSSYRAATNRIVQAKDYPRLIHHYLVAMLANRLQLPTFEVGGPEEDDDQEDQSAQPLDTLAMLAAIESYREEILLEVLDGASFGTRGAELRLPSGPRWGQGLELASSAATAAHVERLATRTPPECFYLRFGTFGNYVWFKELSDRFGGDIAQAVLLRGFNYEASQRMERMMAARMTTLAKLFGDKLIQDMAVVGTDLYMKEGASLGVLFDTNNAGLLTTTIEGDRRSVAARTPGASIFKVDLGGVEGTLLSTPDNRLRSFLVQVDSVVFVTTSEHLARRFVSVSRRESPALSETAEYQRVRGWMPASNNYSVFAYFSTEFFKNLVSPGYQIELRRRLEAIAHLEIAELASRTAAAEQRDPDLESMLRAGLLPENFDQRPDGSQVLKFEDRWIDAKRGARGSFLPIADVTVERVSPHEAAEYAEIAEFYETQWQEMDPMFVGLRRFELDNSEAERVAVEAYIAPFRAEKYGWIARQLGEPTNVRMTLPPDDIAWAQAHLAGSRVLGTEPYHMFVGVKDMTPPRLQEIEGLLATLRFLQSTPAYIGGWPKPGVVEQLPLGIGRALAQPDAYGFSRMLGGLWRWQDGSFSLLSFNRSILESAIGYLGVQPAEDYAQLRVQIKDLQQSNLAAWINDTWYERGLRSSQANVMLLDMIHQQLHVPQEDCFDVAQRLLDVKLQCPLGGEYEFASAPGMQAGQWTSSAWQESGNQVPVRPDAYQAEWIEWFRGTKLHVTQQPGSVALVGHIDLELPPLPVPTADESESFLPKMNFNVFQLPQQLFGSGEEKVEQPKRRSF